MNNLTLLRESQFGSIVCDYYGDSKGEFYMTRSQIGKALEYSNPQKAIDNLHKAHKNRLDKCSVTLKLRSTDGKIYDTYFYSAKGIYEICRHSHQPKADIFFDHVYDILEGLRLGHIKLEAQKQTPIWQDTRSLSKQIRKKETDTIKLFVDYARSNGSTHAERYYTILTKLADKTSGIMNGQRDSATLEQLNTLCMAENIIERCILDGISHQTAYRQIYQACKERLAQFSAIAFLAG